MAIHVAKRVYAALRVSVTVARYIFRWFSVSIALLLVSLAVVMSMVRIGLNYADRYHPMFERWAATVVHRPISIQHITAEWQGMEPVVAFQNVNVYNKSRSHVLLHVQDLKISLDLFDSLSSGRLKSHYLSVGGTQLALRENDKHEWTLNHMKQAKTEDGRETFKSVVNWLLNLEHIKLRGIDLRYEPRDAKSKHFQQVMLDIVNNGDRHSMEGDLVLAAANAVPLKIIAHIDGNPLSDPNVRSTVYLHADRLPLKAWFKQISEGAGSVELWTNWEGRDLSGLQATVKLDRVSVNDAKRHVMSPTISVQAALSARHDKDQWHVRADHMSMRIGQQQFDHLTMGMNVSQHDGKWRLEVPDFSLPQLVINPKWPTLSDITGYLVLDGRHLRFDSHRVRVDDVPIRQLTLDMPDVFVPTVDVTAKTPVKLKRLVKFIRTTPLQENFASISPYLNLGGNGNLDLQLHIPINAREHDAKGFLTLKDGTYDVPRFKLHFKKLNGRIAFKHDSFSAVDLKGELDNTPVTVSFKTIQNSAKKATGIKLNIKGDAPIALWRTHFHLPQLKVMNGKTKYDLDLTLWDNKTIPTVLNVNSNLKGVKVDLPKPFAKRVELERPSALHMEFINNEIRKANIHYGKGLLIKREKQSWLLSFDQNDIKGDIHYQVRNGKKIIRAHLKKLVLKDGASSEITNDLQHDIDMDLTVDSFQYRRHELGKLQLDLKPGAGQEEIKQVRIDGDLMHFIAHGFWRTARKKPETLLVGHMNTVDLGDVLTLFDITDSVKSGRGKADFYLDWRASPAKLSYESLEGNIGFHFNRGRIIHLGDETNKKIDMGRVLNLFSLQTLPRRLSLDFSDLKHSGFSFDVLVGHMNIADGNLTTNDIYLNGPVAKVRVHGKVGLVKREYDVQLAITPYVMNSAPLLATVVGGPIAGAATWVAEKVLKHAVNRMTTHVYQVSGPMDKPTWKLVEQKKLK